MKQSKLSDLGRPELPTGSAMVSEPPGPEVRDTTSGTGVIEVSQTTNITIGNNSPALVAAEIERVDSFWTSYYIPDNTPCADWITFADAYNHYKGVTVTDLSHLEFHALTKHIGVRSNHTHDYPRIYFVNNIDEVHSHTNTNILSHTCNTGITISNKSKFKDTCRNNINNLHLVQPESSNRPFSRPLCPNKIRNSTESSNLHIPPIKLPKTPSVKQCHVCKITIKGKRGLTLNLNRNPNCKRNCPTRVPSFDDLSLPSQVINTVKTPSTSVQSLENLCGDHTNTKIDAHNSKYGCQLCHRLSTKDHFVSSSSHRIHQTIIPDNIPSVDCNCSNVIYLITCRKCKLQYVGETAQFLRVRIAKHTSCINHPENDNTCRILSQHFSQGHCKGATFSVNIVEKLPGDGRDATHNKDELGALDPAITRIRRKKETHWMLKLRTVYPFGLNDRVGDEYMAERDCTNIFSKFPSLIRMKERYKIRTKTPASNNFIVDNFIYIINEALRTDIRNSMNLIRVLLSSLKKAHCRILFDRINDFLAQKHSTFLFAQYFNAALDIIKYKIGNPPVAPVNNKSPPSNCCYVKFSNKALDFINIQHILRDKDVRGALPLHLKNDSPTVIYQLTDTVRSKLFNYKKFVQSLDVDTFLSDNSILPCECDHSPFINHDHGHIISGNLNIVSDVKLRNLIAKGPKYREPLPFSYDKAKLDIMQGLNNCIDTWSNKIGLSKAVFDDWKGTISITIDKRISSLTIRKRKSKRSILHNAATKQCLSELHLKYVMVPIDKAANNIAFVCKRFYAQVLLEELGLIGSSTSTYTRIDQLTPADIIAQHQTELKNKFNISVNEDMLTLPDIYWIPKLHKTPIKFRFIIASKKCTTKVLSKTVSSIFSLFQKQIDAYHRKSHYFSGIKSYWIIQNREPVLNAVKKSFARRSAKCLSSFDFSTLYTKIPHDKLIDVLNKVIEFVYKGGTRNRISIHKSGNASWVKGSTKSSPFYTKESTIAAVSYLIKNSYFKLGNKLFRQDIGIPMGSDPSPAFANLFLFHYESSWLKSIKKNNSILARKFGQVFRYIDDLLALNDGQSFENFHKDIYPVELQLNKENENSTSTNFLDLHISIENGVFRTSLYDKRDDFGFRITRLPYRESNIPYKMFYSSIAAESLRICRASSTSNSAKTSIRTLVDRMVTQGADRNNMKNSIKKIFNRHQINLKYGIQGNGFIKQIFE